MAGVDTACSQRGGGAGGRAAGSSGPQCPAASAVRARSAPQRLPSARCARVSPARRSSSPLPPAQLARVPLQLPLQLQPLYDCLVGGDLAAQAVRGQRAQLPARRQPEERHGARADPGGCKGGAAAGRAGGRRRARRQEAGYPPWNTAPPWPPRSQAGPPAPPAHKAHMHMLLAVCCQAGWNSFSPQPRLSRPRRSWGAGL